MLLRSAAVGVTVTGGNVAGNIQDAGEGATIYGHENILKRMTTKGADEKPFRAQPTDLFRGDGLKLSHFFNGEGVQILYQSSAVTDGDSMVWFRGSDVLAAGDVFRTDTYPVIDLERGGTVQGEIDALNHIIDLTVPADKQEGGTMVVPARGRLCDEADVVEYRDMMTILRDRIQDMVKRGMTLQQVVAAPPTRDYDPQYGRGAVLRIVVMVKRGMTLQQVVAAHPTRDYDPQYGTSSVAGWTPDKFVEAIYKSLAKK